MYRFSSRESEFAGLFWKITGLRATNSENVSIIRVAGVSPNRRMPQSVQRGVQTRSPRFVAYGRGSGLSA